MGQFNGKRICGAPLKTNFRYATRPNLNGECPSGYLACNQESRADNISCVEEDDPTGEGRTLEQRCPIVDLQIIKKADLVGWYAKHVASRPRNLQNQEDQSEEV